ncbi:MAG: IPTL-CTERM sorting domain-containing protein [bacterium]|nr:IPTL-CTERM sorting domain-containing protein [bacterium]
MWRLAFVLSILYLTSGLPAGAQDCMPDTISLTTQADVDNFQANHGPCTHVVGGLGVGGPDIVNLDGLSGVTSVGSSLTVQGTGALAAVDLPGLATIGDDLYIVGNGSLTSVALSGVTSVGGTGFLPGIVFVFNNAALETLELPNLTSIHREIEIGQNDALLSVALPELAVVRTVRIEDNPSLAAVDLPSLETLEGNLVIREHPALASVGLANLTTVNGRLGISESGPLAELVFPQLSTVIGSLGIGGHPNLRLVDLPNLERAAINPLTEPVVSFDSNPSLETLNLLRLNVVRFLQISNCDALTSIDLPDLENVWVDIFIRFNDQLRSVSMPAVTFVGSGILISGNPSLSLCCGLLPVLRPGVVQQFVFIDNNAPGCNSVGEIEGFCLVQIPTVGPWGLALLATLLALAGVAAARRTSASGGDRRAGPPG